ncbi:MAG: hypothetical protein GX286_07605 [Clostridiales bacterium]|jgi:hypothetical protein|nr:hypothetical protein [Clostridiales bacterium]
MGKKVKEEREKNNKSELKLSKKNLTADETVNNGNIEVVAVEKKPKKKLKVIISLVLIILIIITVFVIFVILNKNDGEKIAISLSEKLGSTAEKAAKNADIKLKKLSDYDFINDLGDFSDIYESKSTIKVNGVNVPEWVILCYSDKSGKLEEVVYYNYKILKDNVNGMKVKKKIDVSKIEDGATIEEVEKILNLKPIQVIRSNDDKKIYKYKYYYEDSKSKDEKSYYITIMLNFDDKVMAVQEIEDDYITKVLSLE